MAKTRQTVARLAASAVAIVVEVHEARSANSSAVSNFTEFAVLLTVADSCRGESLAAVARG